jgi:hypothetical protein
MANDPEEKDPVDQLVELFVYAPIGLLYEYEDVMERLVKRGRSQVQLARVVGRLAVSGRRAAGDANDVAEVASQAVGRVVNEIGALFGVALDDTSTAEPSSRPPAPSSPSPSPSEESPVEPSADTPPALEPGEPDEEPSLPIARYDDLKAKEIIPLLADLTVDQRAVIRAHELEGRARKTVLAKLDRLDD